MSPSLARWSFPLFTRKRVGERDWGEEAACLFAEDLEIQGRREWRRFSFPVLCGTNNISMKNLAGRWEIAVFTLISICSFPNNKKKYKSLQKLNSLACWSTFFVGLRRAGLAPFLGPRADNRGQAIIGDHADCGGPARRAQVSYFFFFLSLIFSAGPICILMEVVYRLLCCLCRATSGIIKWAKPD